MRLISVVVLAIIKDKRILMLKRKNEPFAGLWAMPGGKIDIGEHINEAAEREAKEETSLDAKFVHFKALISEHIMSGGKTDLHHILHVCQLSVKENKKGEVPFGKEGDLRWFSFDEIKKEKGNIVPSDYYIIQDVFVKDIGLYFNCIIRKEKDTHVLEKFERKH